jgi:hypothetical protein
VFLDRPASRLALCRLTSKLIAMVANLRDSGVSGFWHQTYFLRGGMEALYDDVLTLVGRMRFTPTRPVWGAMFSASRRAGLPGESRLEPQVREEA